MKPPAAMTNFFIAGKALTNLSGFKNRKGLVLIILWLPVLAFAHPISQGAMTIDVAPDKLIVHARVSTEEVLVTDAFGSSNAASLAEAWQAHGQYFLSHVQIQADQQTLTGQVLKVSESGANHILYDLEYALPKPAKQLSISQNLLNEFLYAPGNPWEASFVVSVQENGKTQHQGLLLTAKQPLAIALNGDSANDNRRLFADYLHHGLMHILTGYDHLLFVIALVLATATLWDLVKVISVFTLAHTLTLTLSVLDIVRLPSSVVEPMIAGSIVLVALVNVFWPQQSRGAFRLLTVFFFGLFHGLGFAGGLLEAMAGLPTETIGLAIVAFSVGVEFGHQIVVLPVFFALRQLARFKPADKAHDYRLAVTRVGSLVISVAGMVYFWAAL